MTVPGKLSVDTATGHVTGPANIRYNTPWPCPNGAWGSGAMMGAVMHTMEGDLPGTIDWFNNPHAQVSAHFGIGQDGEICQFGPIGKGWIAWHARDANAAWYGIEHADGGNPATPLTPAQITASTQLVECLSAFAGFPLQVSDSPSAKGYGWHGMGGANWGNHPACPGDVRKAQRAQIIALALAMRGATPSSGAGEQTTTGNLSLHDFAAAAHTDVATILRLTAEQVPGATYPPEVAAYINAVFAGTADPSAKAPAGLRLYVPA